MSRIPSEYHFIFGLAPDFGGRPFSMIHYLAIASCAEVNNPDHINLYYTYEPSGIWWERAKKLVRLVKVPPVEEVFGKPIAHVAHKSDVLRLQVLIEKGGIYLDLDVLCIRPFRDLQHHSIVLGEEYKVGLCNALILAEPGAPFLHRWLDAYKSFRNDVWNYHSVRLPSELAGEMSDVTILDHKKFFWPMYNRGNDLREFLLFEGSSFCTDSYCVHLWESLTWDFLSALEPHDLWSSNSEFCLLARRFFDAE